jgi:hypothetical protein
MRLLVVVVLAQPVRAFQRPQRHRVVTVVWASSGQQDQLSTTLAAAAAVT